MSHVYRETEFEIFQRIAQQRCPPTNLEGALEYPWSDRDSLGKPEIAESHDLIHRTTANVDIRMRQIGFARTNPFFETSTVGALRKVIYVGRQSGCTTPPWLCTVVS